MERVFCPGGTFDNSPAIYCWDPEIENGSPGGTAEKGSIYWHSGRFSRPSGTERKGGVLFPPLKRWAIISRPSGTSATGTSEANNELNIVRIPIDSIQIDFACSLAVCRMRFAAEKGGNEGA